MSKLNKSPFILFLSLFVVPVSTIYLGIQADIFRYNFTFLSGYGKTSTFFYLWAALIIITAVLILKEIRDKYKLPKPNNFYFIILFILFIITAIIPYEDHTSLVSLLHVLSAYLSIIFLNYILFTIYNFLKLISYSHIKEIAFIYISILNMCFFISIIMGSISTIVETIYIISLSVILSVVLIKKP